MYIFEFDYFTEKDLKKLNNEKHADGYGVIYLTTEKDKYIIDVEYETKEAYDRDGICLELYTTDDDYSHCEWIESIKEITTATDYKRFVTRAKKEIIKVIKEWETE